MGEAVGADWSPAKGLYLSGSVRKKLFGNLDEANRPSFSSLHHVRSDAWLYGRESDLTVPYLTAEYFWRPGENVYGKVMGGLLERMYGGVSTEFLWGRPRASASPWGWRSATFGSATTTGASASSTMTS